MNLFFIFGSKAVNIIYRDHQYPDGDKIRVFINKDIVVPSVVLTSGFNGLLLPLDEGINEIDFLALNQGTSGPNTIKSIFRKSSISTKSFVFFISIFILSHLFKLSYPA